MKPVGRKLFGLNMPFDEMVGHVVMHVRVLPC